MNDFASIQFILGASFLALIGLGVYCWHCWKRASRTAHFVARWFPAFLEHEEFFELIDLEGDRSHYFERHGPVLNRQDILQRAISGEIEFSATIGKPVASARWLRHADLLHAISSALYHWETGARPKRGVFNLEFESKIGEGYLKKSIELLTTRHARVIVREGIVVTAYPVLEPAAGDPVELI